MSGSKKDELPVWSNVWFEKTTYGFRWGPMSVERLASFPAGKGHHVVLVIKTARQSIRVRVTPSGLIRIEGDGE